MPIKLNLTPEEKADRLRQQKREIAKRYYSKNREKHNETMREYYKKNKKNIIKKNSARQQVKKYYMKGKGKKSTEETIITPSE